MSLREPPAAAPGMPGISPGRIEELVLAMILLICEMLLQVYSNTGLGDSPVLPPPPHLSVFPPFLVPEKLTLVVKHADTKPVLPIFRNFYFCICVFYHRHWPGNAHKSITAKIIQGYKKRIPVPSQQSAARKGEAVGEKQKPRICVYQLYCLPATPAQMHRYTAGSIRRAAQAAAHVCRAQ